MKRREFIKLVGGASAISAFSVARSQEPERTRRLAILADDGTLSDPHNEPTWRAFFEEGSPWLQPNGFGYSGW